MTGTPNYVGTIHDSLPIEYRGQLDALTNSTVSLVDTLLRFALGGECPTNATPETRVQWSKSQTEAVEALQHYKAATGAKRFRDEEFLPEEAHVTKKAKTSSSDSNGIDTEQDAPLYTLHAISITSPLRKKVDLIIGQNSLRFVDIKTGQEEKRIPLSVFKRAFLLPTRGKNKPHWTVILLASDTPAPTGKKAAAAAASSGKDYTQVAFGVDASPSSPFTTTDHTVSPVSPTTHPKDSSITPAIRAFLSHLPVPLTESTTSIFRSVLAPGESTAGVQAYRHAKEGTLWFLSSGVLWDRTPCEYWSLADLVSGDTSEGGMGTDGVRIVSATGRTCSVFFRRRVRAEKQENDMGVDNMEEEDFVETDVENIDGKEQDGIARWVKQRKHLFGRDDVEEVIPESSQNGKVDKGKGKAAAVPADAEDSSDEDDSDFVADSDSDEGSATSDSEGDEDAEGDDDGGEGDSEELSDAEEDEDGDGELDPAHHPLLRPGAMPRLSKGSIEAAVGMVKEDFLGISAGSSVGKGKGKAPSEGSEAEDEEDELED